MERPPRLTDYAHGKMAEHLSAGALALDATAGNGFDTIFLAEKVAPTGRVFAFDVQAEAMANTQRKLEARRLDHLGELHQASHAELASVLPASLKGKLAVAAFNLGYLPGGDKTVTTDAETTLRGLELAAEWLAPGALLSVLVYRGHPAGQRESAAILAWLEQLQDWRIERQAAIEPAEHTPYWLGLVKA